MRPEDTRDAHEVHFLHKNGANQCEGLDLDVLVLKTSKTASGVFGFIDMGMKSLLLENTFRTLIRNSKIKL